jgi:ferredoxin
MAMEDKAQYFNYVNVGVKYTDETFAEIFLLKMGAMIEDAGYEAMLYRNTGARGVVSDMDGSPGNTLSPEEQIVVSKQAEKKTAHHRSVQYTRPAREGSVEPDLQFHFRLAAVACGLGEIGLSKMLLTPQFGPLQRVAFLFTDAELEPDPLYNGPELCRKCGACIRECPGHCLSETERITTYVGDKKCEWAVLDEWKCYAFYTHAGRYYNPFVPKEVFDQNENGALNVLEGKAEANEQEIMKVYTELEKYFPSWVGYNMAKCGGCIRACVSMLEKKGGCMEGRFKEPLRTKKAWKLDR